VSSPVLAFRGGVTPAMLLFWPAIALSFLGIFTLQSILPSVVWKQVLFLCLGLGVWWSCQILPFHKWQQLATALYGVLLVFLLSTQVFGAVTRGSRSWIPLGEFHIQPSQVAVSLTCLFLAMFVINTASHNSRTRNLTPKQYLITGVFALLPVAFILLEPDFGSAMMVLVGAASVIYLGPSSWKLLGLTAIAGIAVVAIAWLFLFKPYQKDRILTFLNLRHSQETTAENYNAIQSLIAVGSGGVTGRGVGQGTQAQYRFLPERHTDFIFASYAEEFGLIGSLSLVFLYSLMIFGCIWLGWSAPTPAARLFAFASASFLTAQSMINIGMNIGVFPITGITLPFVSYGGSSMIGLWFHWGILTAAAQEIKKRDILFTL
jgi:rod shape determining protein RodA